MAEVLVPAIVFITIFIPIAAVVWVVFRWWQRRGTLTNDLLIAIKTELVRIRELLERRDP